MPPGRSLDSVDDVTEGPAFCLAEHCAPSCGQVVPLGHARASWPGARLALLWHHEDGIPLRI